MYYTTESILLVNAYLLEVMAEYARVVDADRCSVLSTHVPCPLSFVAMGERLPMSCRQHLLLSNTSFTKGSPGPVGKNRSWGGDVSVFDRFK